MSADQLQRFIRVSGRMIDEKLAVMARLMSELDQSSVVSGAIIADLVLLDLETDALLDLHDKMVDLHAFKSSLTVV